MFVLDNSLIWSFSVFQSWNRVVHAKNGINYDKLKSIQGLRSVLTINVIFIHTLLSYFFVYLDDPTQHEQVRNLLISILVDILFIL